MITSSLLILFLLFLCSLLVRLSKRFFHLGRFTYALAIVSAVLLTILGVVGFVHYSYFSSSSARFYDVATNFAQIGHGLNLFLITAASILFGACVYTAFSRRRQCESVLREQGASIPLRGRGRILSLGKSLFLLLALSLPLCLYIIAQGLDKILYTTAYMADADYINLLKASQLLCLVAPLQLGYISSSVHRHSRPILYAVLVSYVAVFLAQASRSSALIVLLFTFGYMLANGSSKRAWFWAVALFCTLPVFIYLATVMRGMPELGLQPLVGNIGRALPGVFILFQGDVISNILANVTFGVPVTGYVADQGAVTLGVLLIALNPLPTIIMSLIGVEDWYTVVYSQMITPVIPFSAIGELASVGMVWLISYFFVVGCLCAWINLRMYKSTRPSARMWVMLAAGLVLLSMFISTQYTLRAVARLHYYSILLVLASERLGRFMSIVSSRRFWSF